MFKKNASDSSNVSTNQLVTDCKVVISDVEELIKATAHQGGDALEGLREKTKESLAKVKLKLVDVQDNIIEQSKEIAKSTDEYVQENPWKAAGISAGIGLIIGLIIGRR